MPDYIRANSKRCVKEKQLYCTKQKFQSYNISTFGQDITIKSTIQCKLQQGCNLNQINYQKYVLNQQNTYCLMRRKPYLFPITKIELFHLFLYIQLKKITLRLTRTMYS